MSTKSPEFKHDYYSHDSTDYAKFRPTYPPALFDTIVDFVKQHAGDTVKLNSHGRFEGLCVDVATGNGQAAVDLARHFEHVIGVEPSMGQLKEALKQDRVEYRCNNAEDTKLPDSCADLVTVATAMHWFEIDEFFSEADRILKPHGALAVWTYSLNQFESEAANRLLFEFYNTQLGKYWSPRRKLVDNGYGSVVFPFEGAQPKHRFGKRVVVSNEAHWPIKSYVRYISTWSAIKNYYEENPNDDILLKLENDLVKAFNATDSNAIIKVVWPIHLILSAK